MPENKLKKFTDAVIADALDEKQRILKEFEKEKAQMLEKSEVGILDEAYHLIQSEITKIKNTAGKELSRRNMEIRKELLSYRNKLTDDVFSKVKERLTAFCASEDYSALLKVLISKAIKELGEDGTQILVRKEDLTLVNNICKDLGVNAEVSEDPRIKLGSLNFANEKKGILINNSFDKKYAEQLTSFEENSGLVIN